MDTSPNTAHQLELELYKTEFNALRSEILQWQVILRQYLNLCLVAIAGILGVAPLILDHQQYLLLLLFPFIFHVLLSEMIITLSNITTISNYLLHTLIPRVNALLDEIGDTGYQRQGIALGWEFHIKVKHYPLRAPQWVLALAPTLSWVPILSTAGLLIAYGVIVNTESYQPPIGEFLLVLINLLLLIASGVRSTMLVKSEVTAATQLQADIPLYGHQSE
ncbi:MAG: hypothetical protein K8S97_14315 [Anaerolineae bacterium]|nr:hypothetical protein [Anaerolineae bacterium]